MLSNSCEFFVRHFEDKVAHLQNWYWCRISLGVQCATWVLWDQFHRPGDVNKVLVALPLTPVLSTLCTSWLIETNWWCWFSTGGSRGQLMRHCTRGWCLPLWRECWCDHFWKSLPWIQWCTTTFTGSRMLSWEGACISAAVALEWNWVLWPSPDWIPKWVWDWIGLGHSDGWPSPREGYGYCLPPMPMPSHKEG